MALPLIVAGVAAAASWFLSGCATDDPLPNSTDSASVTSDDDPCLGVDCSGHGKCVPTGDSYVCVCERGYYQDGPECLPDSPDALSVQDDAAVDDVAGEDDAAPVDDFDYPPYEGKPDADDAAGADDEADEAPEQPDVDSMSGGLFCESQYCLTSGSYRCDYAKGTAVFDCASDQECQDGRCVTKPGQFDPNCGGTMRAICEVTDIHDVVEEKDHDAARNCDDPIYIFPDTCDTTYESLRDTYPYQCGEDMAYYLYGMHWDDGDAEITDWYAWTAKINPPPLADFYRLFLKYDYSIGHSVGGTPTAECSEGLKQKLVTTFGDEQRVVSTIDDSWRRCVLQAMAVFSPAGITSDSVRIQFQNDATNCRTTYTSHISVIAVASAQLVSCKCFE